MPPSAKLVNDGIATITLYAEPNVVGLYGACVRVCVCACMCNAHCAYVRSAAALCACAPLVPSVAAQPTTCVRVRGCAAEKLGFTRDPDGVKGMAFQRQKKRPTAAGR